MSHGYITCTACKQFFTDHDYELGFGRWGHGEPIQLINNPASWGSADPEYRLLGFSKGATQNKAMAEERKGKATYESIPFKGMRKRFPWLFQGLGLRALPNPDELFLPTENECQSGSIIKCSISARKSDGSYSSGGMVRKVLNNCINIHLSKERSGRSFILFGLDKDFIAWCKSAFSEAYQGVQQVKATTYRNEHLSWVHVAHPSGNQTDPQYRSWCEGKTSVPKVRWAQEELAHRKKKNNG